MSSTKKQMQNITRNEMAEAIKKSGYLLEQRVENILSSHGYYVETNPVYRDLITDKTREYDIFAIKAIQIFRGDNYIFPNIICECKNNSQPVVFFTKDSPIYLTYINEIKYSGTPNKIWANDEFIDLHDFIKADKFHHYCVEEIASQYCSFQQNKDKSWIASHAEEHYHAIDTIIQALELEISNYYSGYLPPEEGEIDNSNLNIYYPLLIFQGDMYSCNLQNGRFNLKKISHIQFRKSIFMTKEIEPVDYQIDIITESFLEKYIAIVDSEISKIKRIFQRNKAIIEKSIEKITEKAKEIDKIRENDKEIINYRDFFENL